MVSLEKVWELGGLTATPGSCRRSEEEHSLLVWLSLREVGSLSPGPGELLQWCWLCSWPTHPADLHPVLLQLASCCLLRVNQIIPNNCNNAHIGHWRATAEQAAGLKWARQFNLFLLKWVSYICQVWSARTPGFHIQQEFISFGKRGDMELIALAKNDLPFALMRTY